MPGVFPASAYKGSPDPLTIRLTRLKAGLSRQTAAQLAGCSFAAWTRYENPTDKRRMPAATWREFLKASGAKVVK